MLEFLVVLWINGSLRVMSLRNLSEDFVRDSQFRRVDGLDVNVCKIALENWILKRQNRRRVFVNGCPIFRAHNSPFDRATQREIFRVFHLCEQHEALYVLKEASHHTVRDLQ